MNLRLICCFFTLLGTTQSSNAFAIPQTITRKPFSISSSGDVTTVITPSVQSAATIQPATTSDNVTTPNSGEKTKTIDQKRVELLLKEKFDRTTPAVLRAWSAQPTPKSAAATDSKDDQPIAVVKNAYEDFAVIQLKSDAKIKVNHVLKIKAAKADFGQWKVLTIDGRKVSLQKVKSKKRGSDQHAKPATPKTDSKPHPENKAKEGDNETTPAVKISLAPKASNPPAESAIALKPGQTVDLILPKAAAPTRDEDEIVKREVTEFSRDVALGRWDRVKAYLAKMKPNEANKVYSHLLKSLANPPQRQRSSSRGQQPTKPQLSPTDILQLSEASPVPIAIKTESQADSDDNTPEKNKTANDLQTNIVLPGGVRIDQLPANVQATIVGNTGDDSTTKSTGTMGASHIGALAKLIRNAKQAGHRFGEFHQTIQKGTTYFGGEDPVKRLTAAELFLQAGIVEYVEIYLPPLDDQKTQSNLSALKIWSKLSLAMHARKQVAVWLERAWQINQSIVALDEIPKTDKDAALTNLVNLSSKIDQSTGAHWMSESFTKVPQRGMTILTNLGVKSADLAQKAAQTGASQRFDLLKLQNEAVEKLIELAPEQAQKWNKTLTLLAKNWLLEATTSLQHSKMAGGRPYMEIDMYGNYYWVNNRSTQRYVGNNNRRPRPIEIGDMLEIAPSQQWQHLIDASLKTKMQQTRASLHLRVSEEDKAFPYIETIAQTDPELGRDLVHEFLRIWTENHDPNAAKRRTNVYIYSYGFDRKADAIPLTRSKQERNLQELQGWVKRIRSLPIKKIDEKYLADAFTTCHSSAEVFKLERFRDVFGELGQLKAETVAALCEKMRGNLASNWRSIRNQEEKGTKRRLPDVQQEILEGYQTSMQLCSESLAASPDHWQLHLVKAKLMFDQNDYQQAVQKSAEYSDNRDQAYKQFALAAEKYAAQVSTLEKREQSTDAFDFWFYAALGSVDLGRITNKTVPNLKQYALIRDAIQQLPPAIAEHHMAKFANNLFTRMSPIKPEIKFRYLKGGFEIVGDHPRAREAKSLYQYYKDLVNEIQLVVEIDGEDTVGPEQAFGVYVNILHTSEIERESGGFGKYVQNQNSMNYSYNYGRPTEDYRDKFCDAVELALGEHFEILNVTFQSADRMKSQAARKLGWRETPYAYILLKPNGPEVDRIASLRLDLDFLDTSGYVVIPVESPALVVDCAATSKVLRPVDDLQLVQTLDERQAADGKLVVEISATAKGLVPDLDQIVDLERDGFELVSVDDQGVLPSAFDKESKFPQIISDRSWTVEYKAQNSDAASVSFEFSEPKLDVTTVKYQRYEDADLVQVPRTIDLEMQYSAASPLFWYWLIPVLGIGGIAVAMVMVLAKQPKVIEKKRFEMPEEINPFTVLTLLKDIRARNGITTEQGKDLQNSIDQIERSYFGEDGSKRPEDLQLLAETWVRKTI